MYFFILAKTEGNRYGKSSKLHVGNRRTRTIIKEIIERTVNTRVAPIYHKKTMFWLLCINTEHIHLNEGFRIFYFPWLN